jgi:hypothetical protein
MNKDLEGFWSGLAILLEDDGNPKLQRHVNAVANVDDQGTITGQFEITSTAQDDAPKMGTFEASRTDQTVAVTAYLDDDEEPLRFQLTVVLDRSRVVAQGLVGTDNGPVALTAIRPRFYLPEKVTIQGAWPSHN